MTQKAPPSIDMSRMSLFKSIMVLFVVVSTQKGWGAQGVRGSIIGVGGLEGICQGSGHCGITHLEGRTHTEAGRYAHEDGVNNEFKHLGYVNQCVFCMKDMGIIAHMAKEELPFETYIGIFEVTALGQWKMGCMRLSG